MGHRVLPLRKLRIQRVLCPIKMMAIKEAGIWGIGWRKMAGRVGQGWGSK
jgi:hypothetical protein